MTDPNDDLSSVADPGAMGPGATTEPDQDDAGDLSYDEVHQADTGGPGTPGEAADSQAARGAPVSPPD